LPAWSSRRISSIGRHEILRLLDGIVDRGSPIAANRTKSLISTVFRFAEDRTIIGFNPAVRLPMPAPAKSRDRVLSEDELHRLFQALEDEPARRKAIILTALMTAARKSEILDMQWDELEDGWWSLPASRTKNGREHRIPLVPSVLAAINALPR